jgi:hypothetical protein
MKENLYNIEEHIHRYAVWTAARAASKSRLKNSEVDIIVNTAGLREAVGELQKNTALTEPIYRQWLKKKGEEIIAVVNERNWSEFKTKQFSFGLAAKIISIYIKTAVVLPTNGNSPLAVIAHPPIDSILLKNINKHHHLKLETNWSTFDWMRYVNMIDKVLALYPNQPYWRIEDAWTSSMQEEIV